MEEEGQIRGEEPWSTVGTGRGHLNLCAGASRKLCVLESVLNRWADVPFHFIFSVLICVLQSTEIWFKSLRGGVKVWKWNRPAVFDSLWPHGLYPTRFLCPWDSPGKNTGVGCHSLLQRIFPTQGSKPGPLHYRQILYRGGVLSEKPKFD